MQDGCFYANTFSQVSYESFQIKYNLNEWLDIFNTNKELKKCLYQNQFNLTRGKIHLKQS